MTVVDSGSACGVSQNTSVGNTTCIQTELNRLGSRARRSSRPTSAIVEALHKIEDFAYYTTIRHCKYVRFSMHMHEEFKSASPNEQEKRQTATTEQMKGQLPHIKHSVTS